MGEPSFLLQLAGRPGSGKSRLARGVGRATGASVLDLDVVKTPLLDGGVSWEDAGRLAYSVLFSLTDDLLASGASVIIDSPSRWPNIPKQGERLAADHGGRYHFVECRLSDRAELLRRLRTRERRTSQNSPLGQLPPEGADDDYWAGWDEAASEVLGPDGDWLVVDTGRPVARSVRDVLDHLAPDVH